MLEWLAAKLVTVPVIGAILQPFLNAYVDVAKAKLSAKTSGDAMAVDLAGKTIAAEIEARKDASAIIIAEQGRWWTAAPRALVQWSLAIFVVKVVVFDTVLKLGTTEPLGGDVATWAGWVMAMWFGGRSLEKIASTIAARLGK